MERDLADGLGGVLSDLGIDPAELARATRTPVNPTDAGFGRPDALKPKTAQAEAARAETPDPSRPPHRTDFRTMEMTREMMQADPKDPLNPQVHPLPHRLGDDGTDSRVPFAENAGDAGDADNDKSPPSEAGAAQAEAAPDTEMAQKFGKTHQWERLAFLEKAIEAKPEDLAGLREEAKVLYGEKAAAFKKEFGYDPDAGNPDVLKTVEAGLAIEDPKARADYFRDRARDVYKVDYSPAEKMVARMGGALVPMGRGGTRLTRDFVKPRIDGKLHGESKVVQPISEKQFTKMPDTGMMDPNTLRTSQDSIRGRFRDGGSVSDLANDLRLGRVKPEDLPPIKIGVKDGKVFALDNRRLDAAREAGVKVRYEKASEAEVREAIRGNKFSTDSDGLSILVRPGANK